METTEGTLLGGRVRYAQPASGFRSGIEPVLLAAAVPASPGAWVLEAGTGAGAGLLCLGARVPLGFGVGVERDPALAALAARNAAANAMPLGFIAADILTFRLERRFDHVFANPPYHAAAGTASPELRRKAAKSADPGLLAAWAARLGDTLRPGGTLSLILPPTRLAEALDGCACARCGSVRLLPLWPKPEREAKLVILQAVREGRGALALLPGLVLHRADGGFTEAAEAILRGSQPMADFLHSSSRPQPGIAGRRAGTHESAGTMGPGSAPRAAARGSGRDDGSGRAHAPKAVPVTGKLR